MKLRRAFVPKALLHSKVLIVLWVVVVMILIVRWEFHIREWIVYSAVAFSQNAFLFPSCFVRHLSKPMRRGSG